MTGVTRVTRLTRLTRLDSSTHLNSSRRKVALMRGSESMAPASISPQDSTCTKMVALLKRDLAHASQHRKTQVACKLAQQERIQNDAGPAAAFRVLSCLRLCSPSLPWLRSGCAHSGLSTRSVAREWCPGRASHLGMRLEWRQSDARCPRRIQAERGSLGAAAILATHT